MHQRVKLISILVLLVVALLVAVWLTSFSTNSSMAEQYYLQIWVPIVLAGALGAMAMHVSHVWRSTSTSKVGIKPEDADNSKVKSLDVGTEPRDIMSEAAESEDKKTILAAEDLLI